MIDVTHRTLEMNGFRMHVAEQGTGPLVILCHGFPESWYSWRHQLAALAEAGFHAVAPDMRGYGQTDRPEAIDQYTLLHLVGDMVGLVDALGGESAVIAGHDWGAPVAWHAALLRPDRFHAPHPVLGLGGRPPRCFDHLQSGRRGYGATTGWIPQPHRRTDRPTTLAHGDRHRVLRRRIWTFRLSRRAELVP